MNKANNKISIRDFKQKRSTFFPAKADKKTRPSSYAMNISENQAKENILTKMKIFRRKKK